MQNVRIRPCVCISTIRKISARFPFKIDGIDSENGIRFIYWLFCFKIMAVLKIITAKIIFIKKLIRRM